MRAGYYSDKYFVRARDILVAEGYRPRVTLQVFGKAHAWLGGIDEAVAILKLCAIEWSELEVQALNEGDEIQPWETVLLIECPRFLFPFARRLISDLTTEGGFPPFMIDPIDFQGIYFARKAASENPGGTA